MEKPVMAGRNEITSDTDVFAAYIPVPGYGILRVNSFLIRGQQPVLIDTCVAALGDEYIRLLQSSIDISKIKWLWITHTDPDHIGNLRKVLEMVPNVRIVTTYLGMGKMNLQGIFFDNFYLLNPGQSLNIGDRQLLCFKPVTFDAPETTGVFDTKSKIVFSADSFGALLSNPVEDVADIESIELLNGIHFWTQVDSPWFSNIDEKKIISLFSDFRSLNPKIILSSHLPTVREGMAETVMKYLLSARFASPFVGPDQNAMEKL